MAFTTTTGNPTSITGTTLVDILSSVDLAGNFVVKADEEADVITLVSTTDPSQLTDVTVYGGDGADSITSPQAQLNRGRTQGGSGADSITYGTVNSYQTYGGEDADTVAITTAVNSTVQGSKGNDTIGSATFTVTNSKVYGGADADSIDVGVVNASTIQGSAGNDLIDLNLTVSASSKINGGSDNDTINIQNAVTEITKGSTINGNAGADSIVIGTAVVDEVTIFGGSGADTIDNNGLQTTLSGDLGADIINTGAGDKVSVLGGGGDDIVNSEVAETATFKTSLNGGIGNDQIKLVDGNADAIQVVMQGRTDSTALTAETGNGGGADALASGDTFVFGNGVDVVTNWDLVDDLGLGLTTTATNITIAAYDDSAGAFDTIKNLDKTAAALVWDDLKEAGRTIILGGLYAGNTFTYKTDDTGDDLLVIQADGNALTANTSMFILSGVVADSTSNAWDGLGQENVSSFTNYIA